MAASRAQALLAATLALGFAPQGDLPAGMDPTHGEIGGKIAIAFLPQEPDGSTARDPTNYEVHLASDEDLDIERVFPAATWFQPPPGKYRLWLEGQGRMSSESVIVRYSGSPFQGRGLMGGMQLSPAGKVALDDKAAVTSTTVLRLLHLDSHTRRPFPQREISRRVSGAALKSGALMPAGRILAALFDSKAQEYTGLARPIVIAAGRRVVVRPLPPARGVTHLVALLNRPSVIDSFSKDDVRPTLELADGPRAPDIMVPTAERIYAVWYGINARRARLAVTSSYVSMDPQELVLRPGKIERLTLRMRSRPGLQVTLQVPEELRLEGSTLEVAAVMSNPREVSETKIDPATRVYRFERLPPELLEVRLKTPAGVFRERADLSSGQDTETVLEVRPIILHGTVYRGQDPHPARIAFHAGAGVKAAEVETDEDGDYEAVLFRPVLIARVYLAGTQDSPYLEFLDTPIEESAVLDFHLPANEAKVAVVDGETGRGILGATVQIRNSTADGKTFEQSGSTDREGVTVLPPLRKGEVAIEASAEGYLPSGEPVRFPVLEGASLPDSRIALRRISTKQALRVVTSAGIAAAGAELVASKSPATLEAVWSGRTDATGQVEVPREAVGTYLLVRHQISGFLVRRWQPNDSGDEVVWQLPPRAEPPLVVRVLDSSGEAVPWAQLSLWVNGLRLEASVLGWLTGTLPISNQDGIWVATSLPAERAEIFAWRGDGRSRTEDIAARSLATELLHPVRGPVVLQVFD